MIGMFGIVYKETFHEQLQISEENPEITSIMKKKKYHVTGVMKLQ
jgi:hypothetical protein